MSRSILLLLLCSIAHQLLAQLPPRELRAAWVATVANIDYPQQPTTDSAQLQREWVEWLALFKKSGLNAVVVQIRPAADAFYPSQLAPWSKYLSGKQGLPPQGQFDPLRFMLQTAHDQGFEFHAWLNPYRATNDLDTATLASNHVFFTHRNWILRYGPKYYLNPALPAVWEHLAQVVEEILQHYSVDAIHMDDYFYPYKIAGERFPDSLDFVQYGRRFSHIDDWRRHNVDTLIQLLQRRIRATRPAVEFGISPFGVWRNQSVDPTGSATRAGQTNYDDLYADIRKWLQKGWIDYVVPQNYFHLGFPAADYAAILDWWSGETYGQKLYLGMGAYRVDSDRLPEWKIPSQLPQQMRLNRKKSQVQGEVFFSAKSLRRNPLGLLDSLTQNFYRQPALWPVKAGAPAQPELPRLKLKPWRTTASGTMWSWRERTDSFIHHYVVLRRPVVNSQPWEIYRIIPRNQTRAGQWLDLPGAPLPGYRYALVPLNGWHQMGQPSNWKTAR